MTIVSIISKEEERQFAALKLVEKIREDLLKQAFWINRRLHYSHKFHSEMLNGIGVVVNIFVYYRYSMPRVAVRITHNPDVMEYSAEDFERSVRGYGKIFSQIYQKVSKDFEIGLFEVNFYKKEKQYYS